MEFKGILKEKSDIKSGIGKNGKNWQSREFVVQTVGEQYPQTGVFELFGDNCDFIEKIPTGVSVTVNFSFKANETSGKWWNKLQAWKVESDYKTNQSQTTTKQPEPENKPEEFKQNEERDELPF